MASAFISKLKSFCQNGNRSQNDSQKSLEDRVNMKRFHRIVIYDLVLMLTLFVFVPIVVFIVFYFTNNPQILFKFQNHVSNANGEDTTVAYTAAVLDTNISTSKSNQFNEELSKILRNHFGMHSNEERRFKRLRYMRKYQLTDSNMICNDGSPAGYARPHFPYQKIQLIILMNRFQATIWENHWTTQTTG